MAQSGPVPLTDGFGPTSHAAWRALAERALKGADFSTLISRTADGLDLQPLYEAGEGADIAARPAAEPWRIVAVADHTDTATANRQILRDLETGVSGVSIAFAHAPSAGGFGLPAGEDTLATLLQDVYLDLIDLRIEPHPLGRRSADWLANLFEKRSTEPARSSVAFGLDPVGNLARWGVLSVDEKTVAERLGTTIASLKEKGFAGQFIEADGRTYHAAGATDAQELGAVLATAAYYLRALAARDISAGHAFSTIGVSLAVDQQQLTSIAKLRAMRLLWRRLQELCGETGPALRLHAETARRMMMAEDPHTNLLRTSLAAFAAGTGGADSIAILPYSCALGLPDRLARRMARNLHHLMLEESNLHRVADPAAGSGAIEALTDELCQAAWREFQAIESEGGIVASLTAGKLQGRIAEALRTLEQLLADGGSALVGATVYANPSPARVSVLDAAPWPEPQFGDRALSCEPLRPMPQPPQKDPA